MTIGPRLPAVLAGGLVVAALGAAAAPGEAAVPGTAVKLRAAIVQERRALRALPQTAGSDRASYARPLAHVHVAITDLLAVQSALATAARETGTFPRIGDIQRLLDSALADAGHASTQLGQAIWYLDHGAPSAVTVAAPARGELRQALEASTALAKLLK